MTNNDREYVRDLERALASAENEIKALEREISNQSRIMDDMQEQINSPLHMGELPRHLLSDDFLRRRDARTAASALRDYVKTIPGGSIIDPQWIADDMRRVADELEKQNG